MSLKATHKKDYGFISRSSEAPLNEQVVFDQVHYEAGSSAVHVTEAELKPWVFRTYMHLDLMRIPRSGSLIGQRDSVNMYEDLNSMLAAIKAKFGDKYQGIVWTSAKIRGNGKQIIIGFATTEVRELADRVKQINDMFAIV